MKQQLPRSARDVLTRQTAADEHPAADLLSGFMEHALSADENTRITTHLAACADCREIVFLASAASPEDQRAVAAAKYGAIAPQTRARWTSWKWLVPVLALLVVVAGVVVRQVTTTPGTARKTVAMNAPPVRTSPPETNALNATIPATIPKSESAVALPASRKPAAEVKASSKKEEAQDRDKQAKRELELRKQLSSSLVPEQQAQLASPQLAAKPAMQGAANAPALAPMAKAVVPQAGRNALVPQTLPKSQSVEVTASAPPVSAVGGAAAAPSQAAKNADAAAESSGAQLRPNTANGGNDVTYMKRNLGTSEGNDVTYIASAARNPTQPQRWRITQSGHLQRWTPAAQWTRVLVDQPVSFKAVTVVGSEVWAGGSDGALFHSADSGEHWTRVALVADGQAAHGGIRSIHFDTPAAGQVTTDSGETWSTSDGGKTWSKN